MTVVTVQKQQEARSFIGRNGLNYVQNFASEKEKKHFEGIIYINGILTLEFLSSLASPVSLH